MLIADATRPEEARIDGSVFEAVYEQGLTPGPALRQKLASSGYDALHPSPAYHPDVMDRCLEVAVAHLFPGVPVQEAHRTIGHRFTQGNLKTIIGKAIAGVFPLIGPDQVLARITKSWRVGQNFGHVRLSPIGPGQYDFEYRNGFRGINSNVGFAVGVLESMLWLTRTRPQIEPSGVEDGFDLRIRWDLEVDRQRPTG